MSIRHEEKVEAVIYPEWVQGGHTLRLVSVMNGFPEVQIRIGPHWWPVDQVIDV